MSSIKNISITIKKYIIIIKKYHYKKKPTYILTKRICQLPHSKVLKNKKI